MKKIISGFILGAVVGYWFNTESGKKLATWAKSKAQEQIKNLGNKVDKITSEETSSEEEFIPDTEEVK